MRNSTAGALAAGTLVAGLVLGSIGMAYGANGKATSPQTPKTVVAASVGSLDATTTPATPPNGSVDPTTTPRPTAPSPHHSAPAAHHAPGHASARHEAHDATASSPMHHEATGHSGQGGCGS